MTRPGITIGTARQSDARLIAALTPLLLAAPASAQSLRSEPLSIPPPRALFASLHPESRAAGEFAQAGNTSPAMYHFRDNSLTRVSSYEHSGYSWDADFVVNELPTQTLSTAAGIVAAAAAAQMPSRPPDDGSAAEAAGAASDDAPIRPARGLSGVGWSIAALVESDFLNRLQSRSGGLSPRFAPLRLTKAVAPGAALEVASDETGDLLTHSHRFHTGLTESAGALELAASYTSEQRTGADGRATDLRTLAYGAKRQFGAYGWMSSDWKSVQDMSRAPGRQFTIERNTIFAFNPARAVTLQTQLTDMTGGTIHTAALTATPSLPPGAPVASPRLTANFRSERWSGQPLRASRQLALEMSITRARAMNPLLRAMTVRIEQDTSLVAGHGNNAPARHASSRLLKLANSLTLAGRRAMTWSALVATHADEAAGASTARARAVDFTLPLGNKLTLGYGDHDQIPQADGTFSDTKERVVSIKTDLPGSDMTAGLDYRQAIDYGWGIRHRGGWGVTLGGATGTRQRLDLGFERDSESSGDGRQGDGYTYHLKYDFQPSTDPGDDNRKLSLESDVTTHAYSNTPGAEDKIDATAQITYRAVY